MKAPIVITGAGTGLGLEMALHLAAEGFAVCAAVLDEEQRRYVQQQASERGVQLYAPLLDVTDRSSINDALRSIVAEHGVPAAVIQNAGISLRGYFEDCDDAEIRRVLDVNLFGAMEVCRAVLPAMRDAGCGRLLFVSSVGARIASMARTAYCSSKFGLEGFAESLMQEVAPFGIKVSIIEPAIIKTERWTVNRGLARRAQDASSPYLDWFRRQETMADNLVRTSPTRPSHVARTVHRALTAKRPRLRYVVGWRARLVLSLRRHLPGELFERLYFGEAMRRVTGSR